MYKICGKNWTTEDIEQIRALIVASPSAKRSELARWVCEMFNWRMLDGRLKEMSCKVAMLKMYRSGLISLPKPRNGSGRPSAIVESEASDPQPLLDVSLSELATLRLETVTKGARSRLWNEYISRYHYLGYKPMPGAQLRYLIKADERVVGAMGFGGAAWKVASRDDFIGWTATEREKRLHLVVSQTRFLILPWVRCQNLATKALAMATKRLVKDWPVRYGYRPALIETFVDTTRYQGGCYKAGNWLQVGVTQGRSKYDRLHANASPVKSVWLMPLARNFRAALVGPRLSDVE
jgi:hypothetical protein